MITREAFVAAVRGFIGTPYRHLGRLPGVALDCAGLVHCGLAECGLVLPHVAYGMTPTVDGLEGSLTRFAVRKPYELREPGDVIATVYHGSLGHHVVYVGDDKFVQAIARSRGGEVRETPLAPVMRPRSCWALRGVE